MGEVPPAHMIPEGNAGALQTADWLSIWFDNNTLNICSYIISGFKSIL